MYGVGQGSSPAVAQGGYAQQQLGFIGAGFPGAMSGAATGLVSISLWPGLMPLTTAAWPHQNSRRRGRDRRWGWRWRSWARVWLPSGPWKYPCPRGSTCPAAGAKTGGFGRL